jgi:branched-subunit amino acid transport protein
VRLDPHFLVLAIGMGVVTYLPRWFPLFSLSRRQLPLWLETWLDFVPAGVLSALILPTLVAGGDPRRLDLLRPELIVAVPVFLFALKTKSMGGAVLLGMALFWLAEKLLSLH